MNKLADFMNCSAFDVHALLGYIFSQLVVFCLYIALFAKQEFKPKRYDMLLALNIVINVAFVCAIIVYAIGWNIGALISLSIIGAGVALFESYMYFSVAMKNFKRDDN